MDTALRPRDIQARIRSGRSVDEVAAAAGLSAEMVARFAAPVLAEREYVAGQAMTSPVRRRGETSTHRKLRVAVSERLMSNRVDMDQVVWDSARMEDGRWAVIARYQVAETSHEAVFHFDVPGRFSVAGNTHARWLLGEDVDSADDEPTLELGDTGSDAVSSVSPEPQVVRDAVAEDQPVERAAPRPEPVVSLVPDRADQTATTGTAEAAVEDHEDHEDDEHTGGLDALYDILDRAGTEYTDDSVEIRVLPGDAHDPADAADVVGRDDDELPTSDAAVASDAAAVPDTAGGEYAPTPRAADYPVEPSLFDDEAELTPPSPAARSRRRSRATPAADAPGPIDAPVETAQPPAAPTPAAPEDVPLPAASDAEHPESPAEADEPAAEPVRKKPKSKRASVPSWDEIMFGSPRSKG